MGFGREQAETVGLRALAWLAGQEDLLGQFLGASGLGASELAARATEPEVLGAVLDFLLADDAWVAGFCDSEGLPPDRLLAARAVLPGGEAPHWT
ncbi:MAG: DUF3572 domain-containing protein [Paracoccaceae bacterium]